jgi:hypothetical protein
MNAHQFSAAPDWDKRTELMARYLFIDGAAKIQDLFSTEFKHIQFSNAPG